METMRCIFKAFVHPELLKKRAHVNTQNRNENVNNVIWSNIPKISFLQLETLLFCTNDADVYFKRAI